MTQIDELKKRSGAHAFASILGKSTIPKNHPAYRIIESAVEILIQNGFGIIHGGYSGGAMSAASDTANRLIAEKGLPKELNIGVPQKEHDGLWERVSDAVFTDATEDIFMRLKIVSSGDIAVICPLGGDGTELEQTLIFHENVIREGLLKNSEKTKNPTPLIFLQFPECTDWKKIIAVKLATLDTPVKNIDAYPWLHFVESLQEFEKIIINLK